MTDWKFGDVLERIDGGYSGTKVMVIGPMRKGEVREPTEGYVRVIGLIPTGGHFGYTKGHIAPAWKDWWRSIG